MGGLEPGASMFKIILFLLVLFLIFGATKKTRVKRKQVTTYALFAVVITLLILSILTNLNQ